MATVTVFTSARMQAIENASVVSGTVTAGNLILTKFNGTTINAGSVIGPTGPTGPTGEVTTAAMNAAINTAAGTGAITEAKLASGSVTTIKIVDGNVTEGKLASNAVSTIKILDGNVTEGKLASNSVSTIKIADGNVTEGKLASNAVTVNKIADLTITNAKISATANIALSKLATTGTMTATTFSGSGASLTNIPNSATTATAANTASAIVARDASGNFNAGTISATFSGHHSGSHDGYVSSIGSTYLTFDYTDAGRFGGNTTATSNGVLRVGNYTGNTTCISSNGATNTIYHMAFHLNGANVGGIVSVGSITSFSQSSDYRLKENVLPISNALEKIELLHPKVYNFIMSPDVEMHGFLAHELAEVVPYAVIGEKDAVDDEGNIRPQQVDYSKLTGLLVGAVQELSARVKELENA